MNVRVDLNDCGRCRGKGKGKRCMRENGKEERWWSNVGKGRDRMVEKK